MNTKEIAPLDLGCGDHRASLSGYMRHVGRGETPCAACRDAHARLGGNACGTDAGWQRHYRRGEESCDACHYAHLDRALAYKKANRDKLNAAKSEQHRRQRRGA